MCVLRHLSVFDMGNPLNPIALRHWLLKAISGIMSSIQYQESAIITRMPQELWDRIVCDLPAFDAGNAAQTLGFELQPQQEKQSRMWNAIFQDSTWITGVTSRFGLNLVLIGHDLVNYYSSETLKARATYLVLLVGDPTSNIQFELFLDSLRPHRFHNDTMEMPLNQALR